MRIGLVGAGDPVVDKRHFEIGDDHEAVEAHRTRKAHGSSGRLFDGRRIGRLH